MYICTGTTRLCHLKHCCLNNTNKNLNLSEFTNCVSSTIWYTIKIYLPYLQFVFLGSLLLLSWTAVDSPT